MKGMRAPKYNYAQRMRKFTGCMQSKRKLSVEWISNNDQQGLSLSNGNVEPFCVVQEKSQRQFRSHANQYDGTRPPTHVATPATADDDTSITSARVHARRAFPAMSTCSTAQQYGMSLSSPTTAHPAEIEWEIAAINTICSVSLLQNVGLNALHTSDRARTSKSMLQSYSHSFERRPKVYMARTKGSVQREKEREREQDSDNDRSTERRKVRPSKKGRKCHSLVPQCMSATFATR